MDRRGALLGPEESGPAHRGLFSLGVGSVSSRVTVTLMLVSVAGGWDSSAECVLVLVAQGIVELLVIADRGG